MENNSNNNRNNNKNNTGKSQGNGRKIIAILCAIVFVACAIWLIYYFVQLNRAEENMDAIKESYVQTAPLETAKPEEPVEPSSEPIAETVEPTATPEPESKYPGLEGYDVPEKKIDFEKLCQEENEHIYAWITVPGTVIDYPVVQHPELPDYYLDYNLDGTKGYPGGIYTQLYNSKDWTDANTVIYGHNMKNGSMFAGLHQYEDPEFFEEYPYIYIYSEDKTRVYEIFAAYEYTDINLVTFFEMPGVMSYEEYLSSIYKLDGMKNNFNTDITVTTEDKIVTLATCIANKPTMRYLVQGVLVAEGPVEAQ